MDPLENVWEELLTCNHLRKRTTRTLPDARLHRRPRQTCQAATARRACCCRCMLLRLHAVASERCFRIFCAPSRAKSHQQSKDLLENANEPNGTDRTDWTVGPSLPATTAEDSPNYHVAVLPQLTLRSPWLVCPLSLHHTPLSNF